MAATWYAATLLALRALIKSSLSPWQRKLVLILYGCSPLVVAAVARDYADGPTIAFLVIALAAAWPEATGKPSVPRLALAGGSAVFALLTQPISLFALLPAGLALLLLDDRKRLAAWAPRALIAGGVGAVIALLVYAAVAFKITGVADLFRLILIMGGQVNGGLGLKYRHPLSEWVFPTTRLFFVYLVLAAGLWTARSQALAAAAPTLRRSFRWALIATAGAVAMMVISDVIIGTSVWQFSFTTSYLLPSTYVLLGAVIAIWTTSLSWRDRLTVIAASLLLSTIGVALLMLATADAAPTDRLFPVLDLLCIAVALLALYSGSRGRSVLPALALLAALCPLASVNIDTRHVFRGRAISYGSTYTVLSEAADVIDPVAADRRILFWFDRDGFNHAVTRPPNWANWYSAYGQVYPLRFGPTQYKLNALDTLNAFYLWDRSRLNDTLPSLSSAEIAGLRARPSDISLVVVSYREEDLARARAALVAAGIPFVQRENRVIAGRWLTLHLAILDMSN